MGYQTRYTLTATYADCAAPAAAVVDLVTNNGEAAFVLTPDGGERQAGKWYEHQADLVAHSKKHPHLLFTLHGAGEESGDVWVKYFLDGRVQEERASMKLDAFDPSKLKEPK